MRISWLTLLAASVACSGNDDPDAMSVWMADTGAGTADATDESGTDSGADSNGSADGSADGSGDEGGEPMSGEMLFVGLCSPCHGAEAEGTQLGYELRHPDREFARWVVRNGRDGVEFPDAAMSAYDPAVLSDAQLDEMFDWLDAFPQPTTGPALYADYCRNCHGVDPNGGGVSGEDIGDKSFSDALEAVREGKGGTNYVARDGYMTVFGEDVLSDAELMLITATFAGH